MYGKIRNISVFLFLTLSCFIRSNAQENNTNIITSKDIKVGAERTDIYFPLIINKKIGILANQTSLIKEKHLVDSLVDSGLDVVKIFSPEHGFRGTADAGESIENGIDTKTGLPVISLYGSHKKPTNEDLKNIDIMLFDLQDVGVRVYTYISTMTYVMEACAENNIPVIILDRPNPNGHYVDGPLLDTAFRSFVGLHPVPLVHGMTIGEYARMVNGERWLERRLECDLTVIPLKRYDHTKYYQLPVKPSPNLPNMNAVYLYPSLVLFEGTIVSVGRGTDHPFEVIGHPEFMIGSYTFTPKSNPGARNPKHKDIPCYGTGLINLTELTGIPDSVNLHWLIGYYAFFKNRKEFFNPYFDKLAGTYILKKQIMENKSGQEMKKSWEKDLNEFKKIRRKYLLYKDFE